MAEEKSEKGQQEIIYQLQNYDQQLQQLQKQLESVQQSIYDLESISKGLDEIKGSEGREILAPLGKGIFTKVKLASEELTVDIGEKNYVKKSIPETKKIIEEQLEKLRQAEKQLDLNIEEIKKKLEELLKKTQNQ